MNGGLIEIGIGIEIERQPGGELLNPDLDFDFEAARFSMSKAR